MNLKPRHSVPMEPERETKRTVRFAEVAGEDTPPIIGTLYVQKHALKGYRGRIEVMLAWPEEE